MRRRLYCNPQARKEKRVKLKQAIYDVVIGCNDDECVTDNWRSKSVIAVDVPAAMKRVRLAKGEYYASVKLAQRADA
jgi:hypothetical protein